MNRTLLLLSVVTASSYLVSFPLSVSADDTVPPPPIITADPPPLAPEEISPPAPPTSASVPQTALKAPTQSASAPAPVVTPPPPPAAATPAVSAPAVVAEPAPPAAMPVPPLSPPPAETNAVEPPAPSLPMVTSTPTSAPVEAEMPPAETEPSADVAKASEAKSTTQYGPRDDTKFQLMRPSWAVHAEYSITALGGSDVSAGQSVSSKGLSIAAEYQPPAIQKIGVIAIGPVATLYPLIPASPTITNTYFSIWSAGLEAHYEARFFREQILVPVVGYDFERLSYHLQAANGSFTISGPTLGLYLLMNPFEPRSAFDFYNDSGVLRTYLTAEIRTLKGSDANINVSGTSSFFGLRIEF